MVESEGCLGSTKNVKILVVVTESGGVNRRYDNYLRVMELNQGNDINHPVWKKQ